jgi:hypothetical protein
MNVAANFTTHWAYRAAIGSKAQVLKRSKQPFADNISPPAAEHTNVAAPVSEQLEVTPRCQHLGT